MGAAKRPQGSKLGVQAPPEQYPGADTHVERGAMRRSVRWATTLGIVLALGLGAAACGGDDEGGGGGDEQGASAGAPVEGKQGGKLTVLTPGVPEERVALLRQGVRRYDE